MSHIKRDVIRIVQGLPPLGPQEVVTLSPTEFVAEASDATSEQIAKLRTVAVNLNTTGLFDVDKLEGIEAQPVIKLGSDEAENPGMFYGIGPEWNEFINEIEQTIGEHRPVTPESVPDPSGFSGPVGAEKRFIKFEMLGAISIQPRGATSDQLRVWITSMGHKFPQVATL